MPLAAALGVAGDAFASDAWPTPSLDRVALVGVRSLDAAERELIGGLKAKVFTMSDIDRHGLERAVRESLEFLRGSAFVHVSLDLDAVDPMFAPGVGTPVPGGLSYREAHLTLELVSESRAARLARARRGEPDPRPPERDREPSPSSWRQALSAHGSSEQGRMGSGEARNARSSAA